jgi:hypothetical protein
LNLVYYKRPVSAASSDHTPWLAVQAGPYHQLDQVKPLAPPSAVYCAPYLEFRLGFRLAPHLNAHGLLRSGFRLELI